MDCAAGTPGSLAGGVRHNTDGPQQPAEGAYRHAARHDLAGSAGRHRSRNPCSYHTRRYTPAFPHAQTHTYALSHRHPSPYTHAYRHGDARHAAADRHAHEYDHALSGCLDVRHFHAIGGPAHGDAAALCVAHTSPADTHPYSDPASHQHGGTDPHNCAHKHNLTPGRHPAAYRHEHRGSRAAHRACSHRHAYSDHAAATEPGITHTRTIAKDRRVQDISLEFQTRSEKEHLTESRERERMATNVGFVGLGAMGAPMVRRLLAGGFTVAVVPHTNREQAEQLVAEGASIAASAADLAGISDVVITSVPDVPQVREVLFGERGLTSVKGGHLLFIDMSTITPTAAKEHHASLQGMGITALDAPVSGGPARAADGSLTIMVGGDPQAYIRGLPVLEALGKHIVHIGPPGSGQAVKLVNQLIISIVMVANAEALSLGVRAGVPLETLTDVLATSSGSNYLLQTWMPKTLFSGDLAGGFALDLLMKDLRAALNWANELGAPAFAGALAQQLYKLAHAPDTARLDYSVVARVYEEALGIALRSPDSSGGSQ